MKKALTLVLCALIALCSAIPSVATCAHNYVETRHDATCVSRAFIEYTCDSCGDSYRTYDRLYTSPESCHMVLEGDRNENILTVTVSLYNNPGFWANRLTLKYNSNALEVISTENGNVWDKTATINVNTDSAESSYVRFYCQNSDIENNGLNGVVFKVKFEIKDLIDNWNIRFEAKSMDNIGYDHLPVPFQIINTITLGYGEHSFEYDGIITEPTYDSEGLELHRCFLCSETKSETIPPLERPLVGDVNGDGTLDMKDSLSLKIRIADVTQDNAYDAALDLYEDGKINAKDLLVLKKMIAGIAY